MNEKINTNNGRFGIIKNLRFSPKLPGFSLKIPTAHAGDAYKISKDCRAHAIEMDCQRARTVADAQMLLRNH